MFPKGFRSFPYTSSNFITLSSTNYVLYLNGVDHLRFKNITIKSTGTSYGRVIYIYNNAKDNRFIGNKIIGVSTTGISANFSLIYSTRIPVQNSVSVTKKVSNNLTSLKTTKH